MTIIKAVNSDRFLERSFLYLLCCSFLIHIAAGVALFRLSGKEVKPAEEPVFIDLQQIPQLKTVQRELEITKRFADQQQRVQREMAPPAFDSRDSVKKTAPIPPQNKTNQTANSGKASVGTPQAKQENHNIVPGASVSSLLRRKNTSPSQLSAQKLMPSVSRLAKLEESYRRKFEQDIAEGDTKFLNSDDIQFGSFLRRFENSVYGVWRYPQEAAMKGIEGIVPVRITFNRRGEIANIQQLESSGAKILDDEVIRTLRAVGPVGSFPKGYDKDEFHLIAFFQYGGARRSLR